MPIFQPTVPHYETIATKTVAHVESTGSGLLGLWPRPVYQGDTRTSGTEGGSFFAGLFGGLAAPQPAYTYESPTPPAALLGRSEKTHKPER